MPKAAQSMSGDAGCEPFVGAFFWEAPAALPRPETGREGEAFEAEAERSANRPTRPLGFAGGISGTGGQRPEGGASEK